MKNLDKMEVFRQCGFGDASINYGTSHMPHIEFNGYDKVMDYCYTAGKTEGFARGYTDGAGDSYVEAIRNNSEIPALVKKCKDLEAANAELLCLTTLDTVELYKKCKDLETANARLFERNHELQVDNEESLKEVENQYKLVAALRNENTNALFSIRGLSGYVEELEQENLEYSKRCDELRKANSDYVKQKMISEGLLAPNHFESIVSTLENSPKSKFVITVEEF